MPGTGSYERGGQPRSVPDPLAMPYATMAAKQKALNERQAADLAQRRRAATRPAAGPATGFAQLADQMYRPGADDLAELRRQQAEFKKTEHAISRDNAWMAVPALAPAVAVLGLEAAGMLAARMAPAVIARAPFQFAKRDPHVRVGDNWATRAGRRAHKAAEEAAERKGGGWDYEPRIARQGQRPLKPDLGTPPRNPTNPEKRYYLELKPNTPTGRAAGARAVKRYGAASEQKARVIYYDPKPFI